MGLDCGTHHARELVVARIHYSTSHSEPTGLAEQVLAVVLVPAVAAEAAVERAAFAEQVLALPRQWARHTTLYQWYEE